MGALDDGDAFFCSRIFHGTVFYLFSFLTGARARKATMAISARVQRTVVSRRLEPVFAFMVPHVMNSIQVSTANVPMTIQARDVTSYFVNCCTS